MSYFEVLEEGKDSVDMLQGCHTFQAQILDLSDDIRGLSLYV